MRRQYLGDAKDAFKWDYLDFLTRELEIPILNILTMAVPDNSNSHGQTSPEEFFTWKGASYPDTRGIVKLCAALRCERSKEGALTPILRVLSEHIGEGYWVELHKETEDFAVLHAKGKRHEYFSGFSKDKPQVVFVDPDTGFEPSSAKNSHVKHSEVEQILKQIHDSSVVVVFQDLGRKSQRECFDKNKAKISSGCNTTAIYWSNRVMFFIIGAPNQIAKIRGINANYKGKGKGFRPVKLLD